MNELSADYMKAKELDRKIKVSAQLAQQSLYDMCMSFKEMRDSKLYRELGYSDFGDYCEQETGFKRTQVYSYIAIAEKLPKDFVRSSGQIGIKKLELLTRISEEERTEIAQNTDLENTTVKELEQQIRQIKAEKDKAVAEKSAAEAEASASAQQAKALEKAKAQLAQQILSLEAEIKELESRPVEVAVQQLPEGAVDKETFKNICKTYDEQIDKLQEDAMQDTIRLNRKHTEELNSLREELEAAKRKQAELEETKTVKEVSVPDIKETFKVYLATAIDAAKRLCNFIYNNADDSNHGLFVSKAKQFFEKITEEII